MTQAFDPKSLGKRAVIQFSSIADAKPESSALPAKPDRAEAERQVMTARHHANLEIEEYRKLVEEFCTKVDTLTVMGNAGEVLRQIMIEHMLETFVEPILKGNKPWSYPEDVYRAERRELYQRLIDRYVNSKE